MTQTNKLLTRFLDGFEELALAFKWWCFLLRLPQSCDCSWAGADLWEELSVGWMQEYIWPYDDWYNPTVSPQRKLRLGR
jgi:hypothetical protein